MRQYVASKWESHDFDLYQNGTGIFLFERGRARRRESFLFSLSFLCRYKLLFFFRTVAERTSIKKRKASRHSWQRPVRWLGNDSNYAVRPSVNFFVPALLARPQKFNRLFPTQYAGIRSTVSLLRDAQRRPMRPEGWTPTLERHWSALTILILPK